MAPNLSSKRDILSTEYDYFFQMIFRMKDNNYTY